jgi:hypothetical protein
MGVCSALLWLAPAHLANHISLSPPHCPALGHVSCALLVVAPSHHPYADMSLHLTPPPSVQELHGQWQPELTSIVEKVDKTFGENFAQIGCAGEVKLVVPEDYDKAAINIM